MHLLTWLSSTHQYEASCGRLHTSTMHYLVNAQVADAGVLVVSPMSQWAQSAPLPFYTHLIFLSE